MSLRRTRALRRRHGGTAGQPVPPAPDVPPTGPPAGIDLPAPLAPAVDEHRGRSRTDTSAILRSLIADVVERPEVNDATPAVGPPRAPVAWTPAAAATVEEPLEPGRLVLPQRPLLPLTAPTDISEPVVASQRIDTADDDGGPEATIRGAVLLALLLGVTVVSAIITYLTLRP